MMAKRNNAVRENDNLDEVVEDESVLRIYELGFHLDPELPTEEMKRAYNTVRMLIEGKGEIIAEGQPKKIALAYTISRQDTSGRRDFDSAYFAWIVYEAPVSSHTEILVAASANKQVIRFIDLITTKEAGRHSAELYELSMKMPEREEDPDAVAGAELDAAIEKATI